MAATGGSWVPSPVAPGSGQRGSMLRPIHALERDKRKDGLVHKPQTRKHFFCSVAWHYWALFTNPCSPLDMSLRHLPAGDPTAAQAPRVPPLPVRGAPCARPSCCLRHAQPCPRSCRSLPLPGECRCGEGEEGSLHARSSLVAPCAVFWFHVLLVLGLRRSSQRWGGTSGFVSERCLSQL